MLKVVMRVNPTATPRRREPQAAGNAKIAAPQSASGSPPLQLGPA